MLGAFSIQVERQSPHGRRKRTTIPRKKACNQCTDAKARCDLQRPSCSRCSLRSFRCHYLVDGPSMLSTNTDIDPSPSDSCQPTCDTSPIQRSPITMYPDSFMRGTDHNDVSFSVITSVPVSNHGSEDVHHPLILPNPAGGSTNDQSQNYSVSFDDLDLVPLADSSRIRNRWLDTFISSTPGLVPKIMGPRTIRFISRVFKTYPKKLLRDSVFPPIIHPLQFASSKIPIPLANCLSLVRLWKGRAQGSEIIASTTINTEMERLLREHTTYDQMDLLAALQAYLIYAIMLFFSPEPGAQEVDRATMINLQDIASRVSDLGLVCKAELLHTRPIWESWIVAEAKRRTIYAMYMLDNLFNTLNDIPSYIADELGTLFAPSSKKLWEASQRQVWEREYDLHLANWEGGGLRLGELWPHIATTNKLQREERIDRWVESVDEFGLMLLATCVMTYGT